MFQEFPSIFFELLGQFSNVVVDYEFTSREIKQLAFRIDGLFLPIPEDSNEPFYLVEVQFQPDDSLYYRIFGEMFLYLKQYRLASPWRVVIIYPSRSIEREETLQFGEILSLNRVQRIYLDELEETDTSIGLGVVKLIVESEDTIERKAKTLVEQARQQLNDEIVKRNLVDLIETIIIYKLPQKSREEIEAMFGLSELKQTKVYQEAKLEGKLEEKLEAIYRMLKLGLSIEIIARSLDVPLETVQQEAKKLNPDVE